MSVWETIVAILAVIATFFTVATTILQVRAPDALTRANLLGPLVCVAFPILMLAKLIYSWSTTGFSLNEVLRAVIAVAGVWIIASVATFIMGRSIYGVTVVDKASRGA